VASIAGPVIELPPPSPEAIGARVDHAHGVDDGLKRLVLPALRGPLAAPSMIDRVITLMRREAGTLSAVLCASPEQAADRAVWCLLLEACQVPGTILSLDALQVLAYSLLLTGQREIRIGAGPEWQQAMRLASEVGAALPPS